VPPTRERVERMLDGADRDPQEIIGPIPPKWAPATVEKIAINKIERRALARVQLSFL